VSSSVRTIATSLTAMTLVAGVDLSTQSTKVELRDLATGRIVGFAVEAHPVVTPPRSEQPPEAWWSAFESAFERAVAMAATDVHGANAPVAAVAVGGQQHGMVALDAANMPVHPAKLWNDTESAADADWLIDQWGGGDVGRGAWAEAVGSVPVAAFTVTKLSWLHRSHPDAWARIRRIVLPHDYLTLRLTGRPTTDRGDASGTGYWSPSTGEYRLDVLGLIDHARDWTGALPEVLGPLDVAGSWRGTTVAPGTGDNMAAALGVGLRSGDAVVSAGTSGTAYAVAEHATADRTGAVAGFADATGRFLPLVCTSNAARVIDAVARLLGVGHAEFDRLAVSSASAAGPTLLPYFDGERTPNRPRATGMIEGLRSDVTREQFARAAIDGVACGLVDALDALRVHAPVTGKIVLVGGAAKSDAFCRVLAGLVDVPVVVSAQEQAVATGAAVQAAAVLEQIDTAVVQERWGLGGGSVIDEAIDPGDLRARYAALRDDPGDRLGESPGRTPE
jgi:xylulokinase